MVPAVKIRVGSRASSVRGWTSGAKRAARSWLQSAGWTQTDGCKCDERQSADEPKARMPTEMASYHHAERDAGHERGGNAERNGRHRRCFAVGMRQRGSECVAGRRIKACRKSG